MNEIHLFYQPFEYQKNYIVDESFKLTNWSTAELNKRIYHQND